MSIEQQQINPGQVAFLGLKYEERIAMLVKQQEDRRKLESPSNQYTTVGSATSADLHSQYERKSAAVAARAVGASGRAVAQAKTVQRDAPDLAAERLVRDEVYGGGL